MLGSEGSHLATGMPATTLYALWSHDPRSPTGRHGLTMPLVLAPTGGTAGQAALDAVDISRHVRQTPRAYRERLPRKDPKTNRWLNNNISRRSEREKKRFCFGSDRILLVRNL